MDFAAVSALHVAVALVPLSAYLILLGIINLGRRPFLTTGPRDAGALGLGLIGFVAAGPMDLLMPLSAANQFGPYVWLLMLSLYVLSLSLVVLLMRPRLVIYNGRLEQIRPALADVVFRLDAEARWAGECLSMPNLGVQLHVQANPWLRSVQLIAVGPRQSYEGWKRLEQTLAARLRQVNASRSPLGVIFLMTALLLVTIATVSVAHDPKAVADALRQTLRW